MKRSQRIIKSKHPPEGKLPFDAVVEHFKKDRKGKCFEPGPGRVMKEWFVANDGLEALWLELAQEARRFVGGLE